VHTSIIINIVSDVDIFVEMAKQILIASQHAVGYVTGNQYYGAKASINVWAPRVANQYEFSLSQMWVISGSFGDDLNTIEAGWQASFNPAITSS
jgi:hypothetical protein